MSTAELKKTRVCTRCDKEQDLEEFHRYFRDKEGRRTECRTCMRQRYLDNPEGYARRNRAGHLRRKYGLSPSEYEDLVAKQEGLCAICGEGESAIGRNGQPLPLAIDHCHDTGEIRGLLCFNCNTGLGRLGDNVQALERAIEYLKRNGV